MKSKKITLLLTFLSALTLSACGGGGGGGGGIATTQFTKSVTLPNGGSSYYHFQNQESRYQYLYLAADVKGSGNINAISFKRSVAGTASTCSGVTMRMGHTSLATLTMTFANNVNEGKGSHTTVINNSTVNIPAGAIDDYYTVNLTTPFAYNGVDNLVVEIVSTSGCGVNVVSRAHSAAAPYNALVWADGAGASVVATGATTTSVADAIFRFAGGENTQHTGGAALSPRPFSSPGARSQWLYTADQINGSGRITGIAFQLNALSVGGDYTYTVKLGNTSLAALAAATNFNDGYNVNGSTTVANARSISLPANIPAGEWIWLPTPDGSFTYNGTSNLLVEVAMITATATNNIRRDVGGGTNIHMYAAGHSTAASTDAVDGAYHMKFRFNGGKVNVITDGGSSTDRALSVNNYGVVNYYKPHELGSAGTISSIACRMSTATSVAQTLNNYKVTIGHSTLGFLNGTAANNFTSQHVGYNGTLMIPAGLVQGDWITINLTSPFAYNGTDSLVVWMGTPGLGAGTDHFCYRSSLAAQYDSAHGFADPTEALVNTIVNRKFDMQLGITN